jgi:hypothetical protein
MVSLASGFKEGFSQLPPHIRDGFFETVAQLIHGLATFVANR